MYVSILFELYLDFSLTLIFNTIDVWKFQSGVYWEKGAFFLNESGSLCRAAFPRSIFI